MFTRTSSFDSKDSANIESHPSDYNAKSGKQLKSDNDNARTTEWNLLYNKDSARHKYAIQANKSERVPIGELNDSNSKTMTSKGPENAALTRDITEIEKKIDDFSPSGASDTYLSQDETADFIRNNIKQRECSNFLLKENKCYCGRTEENHARTVARLEPGHKWTAKEHTECTTCQCFGQIQFRGFGGTMTTPLYLRLDAETDCSIIWELMIRHWKMPRPRLLISVTGGAQKFELKPRLSAILKQGLIEAALNTDGWLITGGTKSGVMEFVGEAVKEHITIKGSSADEQCIAIGVATWGIVGNKSALEGQEAKGLWPADYEFESLPPRSTSLDPNHTHFLLVDDGTEGNFGREIPFRSKFEKFISDLTPLGFSEEIKIPVVLVVVEGGVGTIDTVKESLANKTPVVLIKGSGRAADYLASSFEASFRDPDTKAINEADIKRIFDLKDDDKVHKCFLNLKECLEPGKKEYINVFDLEKSTSFKDIDKEILCALLRADKSGGKSQLALALAWRRCDVAQQQIFTIENRKFWTQKILNDAMFTALVQDQTDFVQLLLDNGVDMRKFLTIESLWNLYYNCINSQSMETSIIKDLLRTKKFNWYSSTLCCSKFQRNDYSALLLKVNDVIAQLLQDQSFNFYKDEKFQFKGTIPKKPLMEWLPKSSPSITTDSKFKELNSVKRKDQEEFDFDYPAKDLFIFAVLFNRQNLAHLFLKLGSDYIGMSLFGSSILKSLSHVADNNEETALSQDLINNSLAMEMFAKSILNECYQRSKFDAHSLLYREMKQFGNISVLSLVDRQDLMDFAEHPACQTKLTSLWKGDLSPKTSPTKIFLTTFFPLLIFSIKFLDQKKDKSSNKVGDASNIPSKRKPDKEFNYKYTEVRVGFSKEDINIFSGIHKFYSAPAIKFTNNIVAYIVLLGLFSFFLLTNMSPAGANDSPSVIEYIVWAWFATLILEEIRQILVIHQSSLFYKLRIWWNNAWNRFDLAMYLLMCVSIVLRYELTDHDFVYARIVYTITLVMSYLRFMQFYFAEQNMGPKVIMIRRMLTDLTFFFFILIVFVLAFGVAYHVNMFPNQPKDWSILYNVLLYPYFQIYGELFLDDLKGKSGEDGSCTTNQTEWQYDISQRCPEENAIVFIFLSIYLVLTNILLINLLIAMFSYTFQKVQDNSTQVWRFHRISLVHEYFDRPSLVPPLIIINHIWRVLCFCIPCLQSKKHGTFAVQLSDDATKRLRLFEKAALETCLVQAASTEKDLLQNQVALTISRLDFVVEELNRIKELIQSEKENNKRKN